MTIKIDDIIGEIGAGAYVIGDVVEGEGDTRYEHYNNIKFKPIGSSTEYILLKK